MLPHNAPVASGHHHVSANHSSAETKPMEALGAMSAAKRKQAENRQQPVDSVPVRTVNVM